MNLLTQAPAGALSATHRCSLKFTHPIPPLFTNRRPTNLNPIHGPKNQPKPLILASAESSSNNGGAVPRSNSNNGSASFSPTNDEPISIVGQDSVPLEGVIQFENPNSSKFTEKLNKWGWVALLAGGDVAAILLFSAIGRFSHGFSVFEPETLRTADPFIAGWFLSAYFLGGYGEDGRGKNGLFKAFISATKSWALGIPVAARLWALALNWLGVQWVMPATVKEAMYSWAFRRRKRRPRAWDVVPLAIMWLLWKERNMRAFEGVESSFVKLQNSLFFLVSFWCTHEVPMCIDDWVSFVENHILV